MKVMVFDVGGTEIVPCHFSSEANQVGALYACLHTVGRMD